MSVDLNFNISEAKDKGVVFTPVFEVRVVCTCGLPEGECECWAHAENHRDVKIGDRIETPDGSKGFSILPGLFQCKNINIDVKNWFLAHLDSAEISC